MAFPSGFKHIISKPDISHAVAATSIICVLHVTYSDLQCLSTVSAMLLLRRTTVQILLSVVVSRFGSAQLGTV